METFSIPDPVCKAKVIRGPPRQNRGARARSREPFQTVPVRRPGPPEAGPGRWACHCVTCNSWLWLLPRPPPHYMGKVRVGAPVSSAEAGRAPDVPPPKVCAPAALRQPHRHPSEGRACSPHPDVQPPPSPTAVRRTRGRKPLPGSGHRAPRA